MITIACIVEGHGEVEAVPVLIRRIATEVGAVVEVPPAIRAPKSKLLKPDELERYVELAALKTRRQGRTLVLVDSDAPTDELSPKIAAHVAQCAPDIVSAAIIAVQEYECWFIGGLEGLFGERGLPASIPIPANPESMRDAKGWLTRHMPPGHHYAETVHQPAFTARFDMGKARLRSPSFARSYEEIARLITL